MEKIINGKRYDTETADEVASDHYWDGSNFERSGRNTYLYKTAKGNFFLHHTTQWQGERDNIEAVDVERAKEIYEGLPEETMGYEATFGVAPEEA